MDNHFTGPIFIGGDNRSGTTLLSTILDSHPYLSIGPELDFQEPPNLGSHILECIDLLIQGDQRVTGIGVTASPGFAFGVQFIKQCHRFGITFEKQKVIVESLVNKHGEIESFEQRLTLINEIGNSIRLSSNSKRWGIKIQKEIVNLKRYLKYWPTAQFIHLIRDGRDVAASHLGGNMFPYQTVQDAAAGWSTLIKTMTKLKCLKSVYEIHYESVIRNPRSTLEELMHWLGIPWHENLLKHSTLKHTLFENPYLHPSIKSVQKPIFQTSIMRYQRDLSPAQISAFEKIAGEQLLALGYPLNSK